MTASFEYEGQSITLSYEHQPFEERTNDYEGSAAYNVIETLFINDCNCTQALQLSKVDTLMYDLLEKHLEV